MVCRECGTSIEEGQKFCSKCGSSVWEDSEKREYIPWAETPEGKKTKRKKRGPVRSELL